MASLNRDILKGITSVLVETPAAASLRLVVFMAVNYFESLLKATKKVRHIWRHVYQHFKITGWLNIVADSNDAARGFAVGTYFVRHKTLVAERPQEFVQPLAGAGIGHVKKGLHACIESFHCEPAGEFFTRRRMAVFEYIKTYEGHGRP